MIREERPWALEQEKRSYIQGKNKPKRSPKVAVEIRNSIKITLDF